MSTSRDLKGMNVLLFLTDQQRAIQHFPKGWAKKNLPGDDHLMRHGLTFPRAFCNACMCSPSRATLMTGYFPAQHGVKWTLEEDMPPPHTLPSEYPQQELPLDLPNLGTVMASAGYSTPYKGKFHLTKKANPNDPWKPQDVEKYGFQRWNPPDAGANQDLDQFGGGRADHDGHYMNGRAGDQHEGVIAYLKSESAKRGPFFLVVSLVNPHDVLAYPRKFTLGGYDEKWLRGNIQLPPTVNEDLSTKPAVQNQFRILLDVGMGKLTKVQQRNYVNFYGNLMKLADRYLVQVLETLKSQGLLENTLIIRTSDHGEMGMAHGGLRQKNFNFYEETLRVPLIYSNPKLFPKPRVSQAMVSHVDFLPTLASLFDVPFPARTNWQGVDYSEVVLDPRAQPPQKYSVFTYDDYQSGQSGGRYPGPFNHIVSIREERYKLAQYYDVQRPNGPYQWEMYDLKNDPYERRNLAHRGCKRTKTQQQEYIRLREQLDVVAKTRLQPLPHTRAKSVEAADV